MGWIELRCKICVQTDNNPKITLNEAGVCNHCIAHEEYMKVDWSERWLELEELCRKHRRTDGTYDCVIAISGGKDSHFIVGLFKEKLDMNPLCVSLDNISWTQAGRLNIQNLNERFDVDIWTFTPRRATLIYYTLKDFSLKLHPNKHWDEILYELPSEIAKKFGIHLVIWGEDTLYRNNSSANILHNRGDLFTTEIFTSYYVPWSRFDNVKYAKTNGFKCLNDTGEWSRDGLQGFSFEQVDTVGYLINQCCKFIKFGYSNQTELCSDAIRQGKMTRKEAIEKVNDYDWQIDIRMENDFCEFIGITKEQFWDILDQHANQDILEKRDGFWRLKKRAE